MSLKKCAVLAAFAAMLPVQMANAQTVSDLGPTLGAEARSTGLVSNVSPNTLNLSSLTPATEAMLQAARQPLPMRGFFIKTHVGAWTSAGTGLLVGAGIAALPFNGPQHEVTGNVSYLRWEGSNGFMFDANYLFNFALQGGQAFTPYAGAGINIARLDACGDLDDAFEDEFDDFFDDLVDCTSTNSALQVGGGLKKPFGSAGRELFGEIFFVLDDGGPIIFRGGVNW